MFEELKSQLDSLAQEVALLKEQQALQTGECGGSLSGQGHTREKGSGRQPAACLCLQPAPGPQLALLGQP